MLGYPLLLRVCGVMNNTRGILGVSAVFHKTQEMCVRGNRGRWFGISEIDITCLVLSDTNDKVVLHRQQGKTTHVMVAAGSPGPYTLEELTGSPGRVWKSLLLVRQGRTH
jgi:hypothetical protein